MGPRHLARHSGAMEQSAQEMNRGKLRVQRSPDRWIGGVSAGLAERWGIDPALVRMIFLLASLVGGFGLIAYGLGWLFLPDSSGISAARKLLRGTPTLAVPGGLALIFVGLLRPLSWLFGFGTGVYGYSPFRDVVAMTSLWAALVLLLTVAAAIIQTRRTRRSVPDGAWPPSAAAPPFSGGPAGADGRVGFSAAGVAGAGGPAGTAAADGAWPGAVGAPTAAFPTGTPYPTGTPGIDPELSAQAAAARLDALAPARRTPGPGARYSAVVAAVALLAPAIVLLVNREQVTFAVLILAAGVSAAALALGGIVAGLRGRRGTWMTACTVIAAPFLALAIGAASWLPTAVTQTLPLIAPSSVFGKDGSYFASSAGVSVDASTEALSEIVLGLGRATVALPADEAIMLDLDAGAVDLHFDLPKDWVIDTGLGYETISRVTGTDYFQFHGHATVLSPEAHENGVDRIIFVSIGAGHLSLHESEK